MDDLLSIRARWQAVEEIEKVEQANATFEERWQQMNALIRLAKGLGIVIKPEIEEKMVIYQRWEKLKNKVLS